MNELYHHGIKGMHWGVRRYQNPDGTLTDAGRRREVKKQRKWNAKNASLLSDNELNMQINRLQKEKQLKDLTSRVISPGRKKTLDLIDRYGNQIAGAVVGAATTAVVARQLSKRGFYAKGYKNGEVNNDSGGKKKHN